MAHPQIASLKDRSRLVKTIIDLTGLKSNHNDFNLAERLGSFVGVSGTMNLARGLRHLPIDSRAGVCTDEHAIRDRVLQARSTLIARIVDAFSGDDSQSSVPSEASGVRREALKTFTPFQRFYTAQQVEMGVAVKNTRSVLREELARLSPELHRLSVLDALMEESLESNARKQFNLIPKALESHFYDAIEAQKPEFDLDQFLPKFHLTMRELLLAELDTRSQPVFGLLEALNEFEKHD